MRVNVDGYGWKLVRSEASSRRYRAGWAAIWILCGGIGVYVIQKMLGV